MLSFCKKTSAGRLDNQTDVQVVAGRFVKLERSGKFHDRNDDGSRLFSIFLRLVCTYKCHRKRARAESDLKSEEASEQTDPSIIVY